jgi:hypothetical protein
MAENCVNICKRLYRKSKEENSNFRANLQMLNNFPRQSPPGFPPIASPAEMFYGTGQRDYNPRLGSNEPDLAMSSLAREKQRTIMRERSHRSNVMLRPFARGDLVWVQDSETKFWDIKGRIMAVRPSGLSYHVQKENGKVSRRNRKYLRLRQAAETDEEIDLEAASISIVEAPFSRSAQGNRHSCLRRVVTVRGAAEHRRGAGQRSSGRRKQVCFHTATWLQEAPVCVGSPASVYESIRLAKKFTRHFGPMVRG